MQIDTEQIIYLGTKKRGPSVKATLNKNQTPNLLKILYILHSTV